MNIKKGNVLDSNFQVIAHQVNCQGVMGAGVAKAIRIKYPEVFNEYQEYCEYNDDILGDCLILKARDGKFIANLFGQDSFGTNSRQTNYKKLYESLIKLRDAMKDIGLVTLSFPYMVGCGLAGGDIDVVTSLIKDVFDDSGIIYNFYDVN